MKTLDKLEYCGKKKRENVQSAESCQKEEATVCFVEMSKNHKADEVAKSKAKPAEEQGKGSSGKDKPFCCNHTKKAKQN